MTKERHIKRTSRTDRTRKPRTYRCPLSLSRANICIVLHATTIYHRPASAVQKHTCEPMRIQRLPMTRTIFEHTLIRHIPTPFQCLGQHRVLGRSRNILFHHRVVSFTTRLQYLLRSRLQNDPNSRLLHKQIDETNKIGVLDTQHE